MPRTVLGESYNLFCKALFAHSTALQGDNAPKAKADAQSLRANFMDLGSNPDLKNAPRIDREGGFELPEPIHHSVQVGPAC